MRSEGANVESSLPSTRSSAATVGRHPTPTKRAAGRETMFRLRSAASELFFERGYHATTMREIALAAGVRVGSVYNHFEGKEDLLFRIAYETMEEMIDGGREVVGEHDTAPLKLRAFLRFHIIYTVDRKFQARVADDFLHVLNPQARRSVVRLRDDYEAILREILRQGGRQNQWIVDDIALIAFGIVTIVTDIRLWYRPDGRLGLDDISDFYTRFTLRALGDGDPSLERRRDVDAT
jgi:AcrR family transcriptional regulator